MKPPREEIIALANKIREFMKAGVPIDNTPKGLPEISSANTSTATTPATNIPEVAVWKDTVTGSGGGPEL